jgi:hypothetical protein
VRLPPLHLPDLEQLCIAVAQLRETNGCPIKPYPGHILKKPVIGQLSKLAPFAVHRLRLRSTPRPSVIGLLARDTGARFTGPRSWFFNGRYRARVNESWLSAWFLARLTVGIEMVLERHSVGDRAKVAWTSNAPDRFIPAH